MIIELIKPEEADETWRVKMDGVPLRTAIKLWTGTAEVVDKLKAMAPSKRDLRIKMPSGALLYPKPPTGWPRLHDSQRQPRR